MTRTLLVVSMILIFAPAAGAADGVLEINQACAENTGCFSGDGPDWPVTIDGSAGRSYRLTGDLIVPDVNTTGISVPADYISIDLNGFAIIRSGCEDSCAKASGTGQGTVPAHARPDGPAAEPIA